jgi:uncharacterized protein (DUF427 family)
MDNPGQATPFHIVAHPERIRVLFEGHELADSDDVMVLSEKGHDDVFYFPREDVQVSSLRPNHHTTTCPWKGEASYFTIMRDAHVVEDIAWSYEHPKAEAEPIAGRIAFDPRHVDFQIENVPQDRVLRHVPAHDPPYADDLDPMGRRDIPSRPLPRTPG